MTLRQAYAPLQPELNDFLFAAVGEEVNGVPLSMISALTRLGFDPWDEAGRLASLAKREAIEQLAQIIARLPGTRWADAERGEIAGDLIDLLPQRVSAVAAAPAGRRSHSELLPDRVKLWLIGLILGAAVLITVVAQGGLALGSHEAPPPQSTAEAPHN